MTRCLRSQWLGLGKEVADFERDFAAHLETRHFVMVDNGSNALFLAVKLLDLPAGSEIVVPAFTWVACAQAVLMAGHRPVFCDVDLQTMNITREHAERALTPQTRAIMVVHYAGLPVDLSPVLDLGLPVIEDAAHAVSSRHNGSACGTLGTVGTFSFDAVKNLTAAEGGGLTCRTAEMLARAKTLRYCGIGKSGFEASAAEAGRASRWWEYGIPEPFIKMLPNNVTAAIAGAQLRKLSTLQARRKNVWATYQRELSVLPWLVRPCEAPPGDSHSYFTYCIRVPRRDDLARFLLERGVYTTLRYHPLHLTPLYKQTDLALENCAQLNSDALSIPLHPRLSDDDVAKVIDGIVEFGRREGL